MKWIIRICASALILGAVACSESSPDGEAQDEQALEAAAPPQQLPDDQIDPDFDPEKERSLKKNWQERHTAQTQIAAIDWAGVEQEIPLQIELADEARETLGQAEVPVLLPDSDALVESATFTSGEDWYAAAMEGDGVSVYVSGTRKEFVHPSIDARAIDEDKPRITRNELIMSMAFKRWGAAYVIEVECARPSEDSRCEDEGYIRELGRSMGLVGGLR